MRLRFPVLSAIRGRSRRALLASISLAALCAPAARAAAPGVSGGVVPASPLRAVKTAVVHFGELARAEARRALPDPATVRPLIRDEPEEEGGKNEFGEPAAAITGLEILSAPSPFVLDVASPSPTTSFKGLDDIAMVDSSYIVIPPDVSGAVGPNRVFQGQNNNYRVFDKADGTVLATVGTATFWAPVVPANLRLALTDPRTLYDPYNDRWITEMQTVNSGAGLICIGVSQTSDPQGAWNLYAFNTAATIDFPTVGFNKNWIAVSINRYTTGGTFSRGITLVVDYPAARTGTGTATLFVQAAGTHFCSAPCVTYSTTAETLYVVTHLSSAGATYQFDTISGTSGSPVYTAGGVALVRPGGGWVQPSGNLLPQSAPVSGASACGATPCPIEVQDSQVRSAPVYRDGFVYYTQTVGLPAAGLTHTGVQWTKLNTPAGSVADGGRIEDPAATSTNGGKWYAFPHVAVNANHDFLVGWSQFSSAQHPSAGYSMHMAGDAAGSIRDALIAHGGEDYYHKTFSTTTGRNRWGDFSTAQVDPVDDMTLWAVDEYARARPGTDDGNTGSNSSKWSTWWAAVAPPSVSLDAGPSQAEGDAGTTAFTFTARLSAAYSLPVQVDYTTSDGTATTADGDYAAVSSFVTIPAGATSATFNVNVNGDPNCEADETFGVTLTADDRNLPLVSAATTATITDDDPNATIDASAGSGGTISPAGSVVVTCGEDQAFTITPDAGNTVTDLVVDGVPVTPATSYTFTGVQGPHTIAASFGATTAVGNAGAEFALGGVTPNPAPGALQVSFGLATAAHARLTVLDLQGRERAVLADGEYGPGWHTARWNGTTPAGAASAGIYFLRYQVAGRTFMRRFARVQ